MTLNDLKVRLIDKPIFGVSSTYGYMLSFEIGMPKLIINERKSTHRLFRKMNQYVYNQKYYDTYLRGEVTFFTDKYWTLKRGKKTICDAYHEHSEIETVLSFLLDGHSIIDISISRTKKRYVSILFSNGLVLRTKGNKKDNVVFSPDRKNTFEISPALGYRYYKNNEAYNAKWYSYK